MARIFRGTRDYFGDEVRWRLQVIQTIRDAFETFGFEPLETPVIENNRTLSGKYGEEGEKRRFRLDMKNITVEPTDSDGADGAGLRYDHTVPLARFVAMNWNNVTLPYRRYVIGPVFRDESAAAGRLRQFTQCDFDTVGSTSPVIDAEVVAMNYLALTNLGFTNEFVVQLNDRRLLNAMASEMGYDPLQAVALFRAWDKLEKADLSKVREDVVYGLRLVEETANGKYYMNDEVDSVEKRISGSNLLKQFDVFTEKLLELRGCSSDKTLARLLNIFPQSTSVKEAVALMDNLLRYISAMGVPESAYSFIPLLARGLDYYTGPIFETVVSRGGIGSITGGGRFDQLIAQMGGPDMPASGSSFGLERVMTVMEQLGLRPSSSQTTDVFVTLFNLSDIELCQASFKIANNLRLTGYNVEVYTGEVQKLRKQFDVANKKNIPVCIVIGPEELATGSFTAKDMRTGEQATGSLENPETTISNLLS